ncbi:hypothetical protein HMPREF0322_01255 [Desulfitobacterium hafniense DP7]|uniref:Uncharacterized protein n=1 Tax=Desulfitobacterium hafniense DP7 TaxID=537010 RepID=G9XJX4_DESHA|nr:hypothetical protein HMPREF0322_01255 [Desulfitobacterium hafniense DP7]
MKVSGVLDLCKKSQAVLKAWLFEFPFYFLFQKARKVLELLYPC